MSSRCVLVHRPSRLCAATAVLAAEFLRGDGVLTDEALESGKAIHHFDGVMSHNFIVATYPIIAPNQSYFTPWQDFADNWILKPPCCPLSFQVQPDISLTDETSGLHYLPFLAAISGPLRR